MTSPKRCYVAMPFGRQRLPDGGEIDFDLVYEAVRPVVEDAGFTPLRPDNVVSTGTVSQAVVEAVARCEVMIADVSTPSPYVFYELGLRHALAPRTTLLLRAEGGLQLANLQDVRTYAVPRDRADGAFAALREGLAAALRPGGGEAVDSPFYRLFAVEPPVLPDDPPSVRHRRERADLLRSRLVTARSLLPEEGVAELREIESALHAVGLDDDRLWLDVMLAYRDQSAWGEVVRLVSGFPEELRQTPTVVQQNALALNRRGEPGDAERAAQDLEGLIARDGPDSETYGLLGRIHKDRYKSTGHRTHLDAAIEAYRAGWEADRHDYYPGINLVTLLTVAGGPAAEEEVRQVVPQLRDIVEERITRPATDYWDVATALELAVLAGDWDRAKNELVARSRARATADWMLHSTADNLRVLAKAMPDDGVKVEDVVQHLLAEASVR
jgi:hypothetical protein